MEAELSYGEVHPKILIGEDNWHLIVWREIWQGSHKQSVASYARLVNYSAIDYSGPMIVTIGKKTEKRWGVSLLSLWAGAELNPLVTVTRWAGERRAENELFRRGLPTPGFDSKHPLSR
ncbi:hypothetical protein EVAR_57217_1 [Eumeta japonica]|uniref:Uncharacterized protein n=1 Tax=Eumeta variegata TaxID=151549 RepID=A0A4C1YLG0_EUMVA|nr:hypothetical protein EVAR_57217_1 [Eumeta japonica]